MQNTRIAAAAAAAAVVSSHIGIHDVGWNGRGQGIHRHRHRTQCFANATLFVFVNEPLRRKKIFESCVDTGGLEDTESRHDS